MNFALITADASHKTKFFISGERGDCTSFMNWVNVWDGIHLSYIKLRDENLDYLKSFDVVMFSGHPGHLVDIIKIAQFLKSSQTITMFYPEGSIQLFDSSIANFHPEIYEAWNACDIVSSAEEDKIDYYKAYVSSQTVVRFIHVPLREEMMKNFHVPLRWKDNRLILVYGDNNPNHPLIALACANHLGMEVVGIDLRSAPINRVFPRLKIYFYTKLAQYPYLRLLGRTIVHIYPTEWIGTARQQIACACVGTPCIGSRDSHTQLKLFPKLAVQIYDVNTICQIIKELRKNNSFYEEVVDEASKNISYYSLEETKKRFIEAVEFARAKKKISVPT